MGRYLQNISLLDGLTGGDFRAAARDASAKAGVQVEYRAHPMPGSAAGRMNPPDPDVGSLYWRDSGHRDLSEFWQLYDLALTRIRADKGA
jgi:hypothetical protein